MAATFTAQNNYLEMLQFILNCKILKQYHFPWAKLPYPFMSYEREARRNAIPWRSQDWQNPTC